MTVIAVAGKGGVGKTSLSSLLIQHLSVREPPVLAIDADPNSNLGEKLGLEPESMLSDALDSIRDAPPGMAKHDLLSHKAREALTEGKGSDLLIMGRPQGKGCYCFANSVLRDVLQSLVGAYRHVLIDNEAGMEHLSRGTVPVADVLLVVSDPTAAGLRSAMRILELSRELEINAGKTILVVNSVQDSHRDVVRDRLKGMGVRDYNLIPYDEAIMQRNMDGDPLMGLEGSVSAVAVSKLAARITGGGS